MPSERSPLIRGDSVPLYVFHTQRDRLYRQRVRRLQCCICSTVMSITIFALVVTISYSVIHNEEPENSTMNSNLSSFDQLPDAGQTGLVTLSEPVEDEKEPVWKEPLNESDIAAAVSIGRQKLYEKERFEEFVPPIPVDSPFYRHRMATPTTPEARALSRAAFILEEATRALVKNPELGKKIIGRSMPFNIEWLPADVCSAKAPNPCEKSRYRTLDGSCNNWEHPRTWGVAMRPFRRIIPPDYSDGISAPRKAQDRSNLPSARQVSTTVIRPSYREDPKFTVMLAVWGQFVDHDMTATAINTGSGGNSISCCYGHYTSGLKTHPECYTVTLGKSDPYYAKYNITCMEFVRSSPAPMCSLGPREQLNQASNFIDGSLIYGNNEPLLNELRSFKGGELKTLMAPGGVELLPISTKTDDGCNQEEELAKGRYCFLTGDDRANENMHITTMHLLWVRHHNNLARNLAKVNPHWTDEQLFQEARKIVGAQMQHITYNEFLPVVLGPKLMSKLRIDPRTEGYCDTYDPDIDPSIANSFSSSAFRFGHTLLPGLFKVVNRDNTSEEYIEMHRMLFNPFSLYDKDFIENAVRGGLDTSVEKVDTYFNPEFTQKLFQRDTNSSKTDKPQNIPFGLDLVSLNIQRGRDHGLPGYPFFRRHCNLSQPESFEDLETIMDPDSLSSIRGMYKAVDDIDLYAGALAEVPLKDSLIGPTLTCLISDQFLRLQRGDRFWYENPDNPQAFTPAQLDSIRNTTLAKVLCETSGVDKAQPRVMEKTRPGNEHLACSEFPDLDFTAWKETAEVGKKVELAPQENSKVVPTVVKIGGRVKSGNIVAEGVAVWNGELPLRIPLRPLNAVAENSNVPAIHLHPPVFAHGVLWTGNFSISDGIAHIEGQASLPQYVRQNGRLVSINWYNGAFSFDVDVDWSTIKKFNLQGQFSTPIRLRKESAFAYNSTVYDLHGVKLPSADPEQELNENVAPVYLKGVYAPDGKSFLWSGKIILVLPTSGMTQENSHIFPENLEETENFRLSGSVLNAKIKFTNGENLWKGLPLAFPVNPFGTTSSDISMGVRWQGSLLTIADKTASLSVAFSLPEITQDDSLNWFEGELTTDFRVNWWNTDDGVLNLEGNFTSPVYFGDREQYEYLKDVPATHLDTHGASLKTSPTQEGGPTAPLILFGTFSQDGRSFIWSGNFTLILPKISKEEKAPIEDDSTRFRVVGGKVEVADKTIWDGEIPFAVATSGIDYLTSHDKTRIIWTVIRMKQDGKFLEIQGTFSLPKKNNTWLNGNFNVHVQTNSSFDGISGPYVTPVYLSERLNNILDNMACFSDEEILPETKIPAGFDVSKNYPSAPIILYGVKSMDQKDFLWGGEGMLIIPRPNQDKLTGFVRSGNISLDGVELSTPVSDDPISIPLKIFDSVRTSYSAMGQPPAYGQDLMWSGKLENLPDNTSVLSGKFSMPTFTENSTKWHNGVFNFTLDPTMRSNNFEGDFSGPVYFRERPIFLNNTTESKNKFMNFTPSDEPTIKSDINAKSIIILHGTVSEDGTILIWPKEITLILIKTRKPRNLIVTKSVTDMKPSGAVIRYKSVTMYTKGGSIKVGDKTVWLGNRLPLVIPVDSQEPVISSINQVTSPQARGKRIPWQGYVRSDSPMIVKSWGSYSMPQTDGNYTSWYNGEFALEFQLLDELTNLSLNGDYLSSIFLHDQKFDPPTSSPEWTLHMDQASRTPVPGLEVKGSSNFIPVILHGTFSPSKSLFKCSGNVTIMINYNHQESLKSIEAKNRKS